MLIFVYQCYVKLTCALVKGGRQLKTVVVEAGALNSIYRQKDNRTQTESLKIYFKKYKAVYSNTFCISPTCMPVSLSIQYYPYNTAFVWEESFSRSCLPMYVHKQNLNLVSYAIVNIQLYTHIYHTIMCTPYDCFFRTNFCKQLLSPQPKTQDPF